MANSKRLLLLLGVGFLFLAGLLIIAVISRAAGSHPPGNFGQSAQNSNRHIVQAGEEVDNVTVPAGDITIEAGAVVRGNVNTPLGDVFVAGVVSDSVTSLSGNVTLAPTARIGGNVLATNGDVFHDPAAEVAGQISAPAGEVHDSLKLDQPRDEEDGFFGFLLRLFAALLGGALVLAFGGVIMLVAPRQVARTAATLEHALLPSAILGLLTAVLLPLVVMVVSLVLAITIIGPFILWLIVVGGLLFGLVALGIAVGEYLAQTVQQVTLPRSPLARGLLGLGLILAANALVASLLPWLGWGLIYLLSSLGLGAAVLSRGGTIVPVSEGGFNLRRITHPLAGPEPPDERKAS
jgi:hypothetical protein